MFLICNYENTKDSKIYQLLLIITNKPFIKDKKNSLDFILNK